MKKFIYLILSMFTINLSANSDFITIDNITYKTVNNQDLKLNLYIPAVKKEKYPLIIWIHGGAWFRGSKDDLLNPKARANNVNLANELLKNGYAIASLDYRLSGVASYPACVQDINDAINFLYNNESKYHLNAKELIVAGRSAGAHLTELVSVLNTTDSSKIFGKNKPKYKVKVAVAFFAPSNILNLILKGKEGADKTSPESRFLGGYPADIPNIAREASPTTYVSKNTVPFILMHGDKDTRVPLDQSILFHRLLDGAGVENEFYIAKGAKHGDVVFDTNEYVSKVLNFVKKHYPIK